MKKIIMFLVFIGLTWVFGSLIYSQDNRDYQAWLAVESQDSHLKIKAYCRNNSSEDSVLRYNLTVQKRGKSGRTSSAQSGSVYLRSQEEKCVSKLNLRVSPKDEYEIKLEVYKDGKLVTEDFVVYSRGTWI